jgi:hypothetical protein
MSAVVLLRDLPESARRSLAPSLPFRARGVVLFDVPARVARRFGAAINADGLLVLSREVPRAER